MSLTPKNFELVDDRWCFACGTDNPHGLKLKFTLDPNDELVSELVPDRRYQGFSGVLHGGVMALLLDEMMVNLAWLKGLNAVSASLEVRFKKPVRTGQKILLRARLICEEKKLVKTEAWATNVDGTVLAEAQAVCVKMKKHESHVSTRLQ